MPGVMQQRSLLAAAALLGLCSSASVCDAAVHPYADELFYSVSDAYIFRGGREGAAQAVVPLQPSGR